MKIALITSERLFEFPPVITLLHTLDRMGHDVVFLTPYRDPEFEELHLQHTRHLFSAETPDERLTRYYSNRIAASAAFRSERLLRSRCIRQIPVKFKTELKQADVVRVLHENTFLLGCRHVNTEVLVNHGLVRNGREQTVAGFHVYPAKWFNPLDSATGELVKTENTVSIHWYSMSWISPLRRMRVKIMRRIRLCLKKLCGIGARK